MEEFYDQLSQFKVRPQARHSLPFPDLSSRICSSIICSQLGLAKEAIKLNLILSKESREFIITQQGLQGFLLRVHDNFDSLFYEFKISREFARKYNCYMTTEEINILTGKL